MSEPQELDRFIKDTFDSAFAAHTAGRLQDAENDYRLLLALDECHAAATHYLGVLLHQADQPEEALGYLRRASALVPTQADWRNDLGNVLFAQKDYAEAVAAYREALLLRADDAQLWNNCGAALRAQGRSDEAIAACRRALELSPQFAPAMQQLAELYNQAGDLLGSAHYQCMAYVLEPHEGKSREMLGISFYFLGRLEEAAQMAQRWMVEEPDNPTARHMYAAYAGLHVTEASPAYIAQRFDDYADNFEANLVSHLDYRGPHVLASLMTEIPEQELDVLDLGCGTGLCAPVLKPRARRLDGVDLSGNMLRHAAARNSYTQLARSEATEWMRDHQAQYDLVVACDVLIYRGQLEEFFSAARFSLRNSGHLLFTTEVAADNESGEYCLHPSGRFRHQTGYVLQSLAASGFKLIEMSTESIRIEMCQPVPGLAVLAKVSPSYLKF